MSTELQAALVKAVKAAGAPGAVAYVGHRDQTLYHGAAGQRQLVPVTQPATAMTPYDLASLTKVVATATAVMILRDEGALDLDQPADELVPIPAFNTLTVRQLLTHTAGLPSFKPWYVDASTLNEYLWRMARLPLSWRPGTRRNYSDLGFMILGKVVELVSRDSLGAFCDRRIFRPLGMSNTVFRPPETWRSTCAATEQCPWRGRVMAGEVHDESAYAVGGVSGHAGLFATAEDLARFCRAFLTAQILPEATIDEMTRLGQVPYYPWQGLGWKLDPWMGGSEGFLPARTAIGHTGWTGTAIWMDRASGYFAILLSNTCHPRRGQRNNRALRRVFYTRTAATLYPRSTNVHTGLDRVLRESFDPLRGRRIALLTNHAAVDQLGRHILDVLALEPEVMLKRIYSPEHGLEGRAEAGERIPSQSGPIPITSLYGGQKQPARDELEGIELFVADLPDVGARYYTYMATLRDCMAACAQARVPVLVLDRPNPLGGAVLEGPIATKTGSPVCCAPLPIRHGMTLGELALFFWKTDFRGKRLQVMVNAVDNWPRERLFGDSALPWVPPSPNIPTPETALLYVGMCLFEGTNLNEGRGTDTPFALLGAPWLDPEAVLAQLDPQEHEGCALEAMPYTPRAIPGKASKPRFEKEVCQGIRVTVHNAERVRAFTLAAALLRAIRLRHPDAFEWTPFFDILAGGPWLRERINAGVKALDLVQELAPDLDAFDRKRPRRYATLGELLD